MSSKRLCFKKKTSLRCVKCPQSLFYLSILLGITIKKSGSSTATLSIPSLLFALAKHDNRKNRISPERKTYLSIIGVFWRVAVVGLIDLGKHPYIDMILDMKRRFIFVCFVDIVAGVLVFRGP